MDLKNFDWSENYHEYLYYLKSISDDKYREFNRKITPTGYPMLGVRIPILRKMAKEIYQGDYKSFLKVAGKTYFEEVLILGLVLAGIDKKEELEKYFDSYIDLIDNWAICDSFCNSLKIVGKNEEYFLEIIDSLVRSGDEYRVRVGLILLLSYYVEEEYLEIIYRIIGDTESEYYYVNMARAWLLCEVFVKYQEQTLEFLQKNTLDRFTINKMISKIRDSYRVDKVTKDYIVKFRK